MSGSSKTALSCCSVSRARCLPPDPPAPSVDVSFALRAEINPSKLSASPDKDRIAWGGIPRGNKNEGEGAGGMTEHHSSTKNKVIM